jgi:hypothetical protein
MVLADLAVPRYGKLPCRTERDGTNRVQADVERWRSMPRDTAQLLAKVRGQGSDLLQEVFVSQEETWYAHPYHDWSVL